MRTADRLKRLERATRSQDGRSWRFEVVDGEGRPTGRGFTLRVGEPPETFDETEVTK